MNITDELRAYVKNDSLHCFSDYLAIADRIDAEHQKACDDAWNNGYEADYLGIEKWLTEHPQAMEHHGWVSLPKDADGEYIHIGDEMENLRKDLEPQLHHRFRVYSIHYRDYGQVCVLAEDGYPSILYRAEECRHYHAPTVENLLREFAERWDEPMRYDRDEMVEQYAAKLKLADDGEEQ